MRTSVAIRPRSVPRTYATSPKAVIFERYSESSIKAVLRAQYIAKKLYMKEIFTDHLLVAVVETDPAISKSIDAQKLHDVLNSTYPRPTTNVTIEDQYFSEETRYAFKEATRLADKIGMSIVVPSHLFKACLSNADNKAVMLIEKSGVDPSGVKEEVKPKKSQTKNNSKVLQEVCIDLNAKAMVGKIDPVVGRDVEIERVIQILTRRTKNNPLLLGKPGVGKSAIAEGLAYLCVKDPSRLPFDLRDKRFMQLDIGALMSGTSERGSLEQRVTDLIKEVKGDPDLVLVIDEIHMLIGMGKNDASEGGMNIANIIKPPLARGELTCIGATTLMEHAKYFESDAALARRFQPVIINETTESMTLNVLKGIKKSYEDHHSCTYSAEALEAAVSLTNRYMPYRNQPDKAIDAMDESGSLASIEAYNAGEKNPVVTTNHVMRVVSDWSGVPMLELDADDAKKLRDLERTLSDVVIGQPRAVNAVCMAMARASLGLRDPKRPIATFLFVGPTGVGKTELAKSLCKHWYGTNDAMIRFDMSEFMENFSVSRLIGAPPGYAGYDQAGQLTDAVKRQPYSILLFDEIEKAHPEVTNILLQAMDDGRLTDSKGNTVSLKHNIIILTSNLGANGSGDSVERFFRPEFINRLDDVIEFDKLSIGDVARIAQILLNESLSRIQTASGTTVHVSALLKEVICDEGFSSEYGARPIRRAICKYIEDPVADLILNNGEKLSSSAITLDWDGNKTIIVSEKSLVQ